MAISETNMKVSVYPVNFSAVFLTFYFAALIKLFKISMF